MKWKCGSSCRASSVLSFPIASLGVLWTALSPGLEDVVALVGHQLGLQRLPQEHRHQPGRGAVPHCVRDKHPHVGFVDPEHIVDVAAHRARRSEEACEAERMDGRQFLGHKVALQGAGQAQLFVDFFEVARYLVTELLQVLHFAVQASDLRCIPGNHLEPTDDFVDAGRVVDAIDDAFTLAVGTAPNQRGNVVGFEVLDQGFDLGIAAFVADQHGGVDPARNLVGYVVREFAAFDFDTLLTQGACDLGAALGAPVEQHHFWTGTQTHRRPPCGVRPDGIATAVPERCYRVTSTA